MKRFFLVLLPSVVGYGYFLKLLNEEKVEALSSLIHFFFHAPLYFALLPTI